MKFVIYEGVDEPGGQKGKWRWRLRSGSDIIATSGEGYVSRTECREMIEKIQAQCPAAKIEEPATRAVNINKKLASLLVAGPKKM